MSKTYFIDALGTKYTPKSSIYGGWREVKLEILLYDQSATLGQLPALPSDGPRFPCHRVTSRQMPYPFHRDLRRQLKSPPRGTAPPPTPVAVSPYFLPLDSGMAGSADQGEPDRPLVPSTHTMDRAPSPPPAPKIPRANGCLPTAVPARQILCLWRKGEGLRASR